ncbi:MAG: helix-turn-helix transcriptional regulator [Clostridia bacterium]|nr:helix-turn-helix transcriptional regulator [Clostridia bacterium]
MEDNYVKMSFESVFNIEKIITIFYMEFSKNFYYEGERHDFWEMVYIDKGEMICTADTKRFILKSGEMTFHKPNEFHNLSGDNSVSPNVSILTFECKSRAMKHFEGKIFRLNAEEKNLLSMLFEEGLSCFRMADSSNPLLQRLEKADNAPFGSSQMTKNLLEIFLIKLQRNTNTLTKAMRQLDVIDGVDTPHTVKEILDYLKAHVYGRVTIQEVAEALGKSESSVKQQFARYRDSGIIHHYNYLKVKEAKRLIREGRYNMTQIADLLQFDSPQYFSKCFRSFTNMTPTEYKRSIVV